MDIGQLTLWGGIYYGWSVVLRTLAAICQELNEEEMHRWLLAFQSAEFESYRVESAAERFWRTNSSNELINFYYRGFPILFADTLKENLQKTLRDGTTLWMNEAFLAAESATLEILEGVSKEDKDYEKRHRLHAFPRLIALQLLPHAAEKATREELCHHIEKLLEDIQENRIPYTKSESALNQLNQIVSQILTEQIRVGEIAWNNMFVTDKILEYLIAIGEDYDKSIRFETSVPFSLQFLVYYRLSLKSPKKQSRYADCEKQAGLLDNYFERILREEVPLDRSFLFWLTALRNHANNPRISRDPTRRLLKQAIIMAQHAGAQIVPPKIWQLSVLNNFRAAHHAHGGSDCEDRRRKIACYLSGNGVTQKDGIEIIDRYIENEDFRGDMEEFVKDLPEEKPAEQRMAPGLFLQAPEVTVDEIWAALTKYRTWDEIGRHLKGLSLAARHIENFVVDSLTPTIMRFKRDTKARKRSEEIRDLIRRYVKQELDEIERVELESNNAPHSLGI